MRDAREPCADLSPQADATPPADVAMSDVRTARAHLSSRALVADEEGRGRGRGRSVAGTLITLALAAVVLWGVVAGIGGGGSPDRVRSITSRLKCPVCQGESVADSPSQSAQDITALVRQQVTAGNTDGQIEQFFVDRYGQWILLDPPRRGTTAVLWAVPLLAVTAGAVALISLLEPSRRRRLLIAGAATLGLASTATLIVVGAAQRTPRDQALGAAPVAVQAATPVVQLAAVTNEQMEVQIARTPNVVGMRLALVERYLADGNIAKAYEHTSIAINSPATDQEYEKALRLHGWVTSLEGAPASGAQYLRAALTLSPDDRDALYYLARVELTGLHDPVAAGRSVDRLAATDLTPEQRTRLEALAAEVRQAIATSSSVSPAARAPAP